MRGCDTTKILLARQRRGRYEKKHPERVAESKRKYVDKNRIEINIKNKERAKKKWWTNPEKYRKQQREKYHANIEDSRQRQREYYWKNAERQQGWTRKYTRKLREEVIDGYGGKCSCCGENQFEFLALDHVNGGGNRERQSGKHTYTVYRDVVNRNFPSDYQILCHNCNNAKGFYGICPHNLKRFE